jgi:Galactose oxidase-like, Early set domain/Glyoxal oxidase N-terminus
MARRLATNARSPAAGSAGDLPPPAVGATGQMDRRNFLLAGTAGTAGAVLLGGRSLAPLLSGSSVTARVAATPATAGQWTATFNLTLVSIHAVVLHTGNVLLFSWPKSTVGSDAVLWNPVSGSKTNIALTYQRDIFCGGMTVLANGHVFTAGGHIYQGALTAADGVSNTTLFDPASNAWTEGPTMDVPRWYPTVAQLGDGTVRVLGGSVNTGANAVTLDAYDPSTNTLTVLPSTANKSMSLYPRVKLTTTGLLAFTNLATTYFLNPATSTWTTGPKLNSGTRAYNDMAVLLPGLTKIMEIGGSNATTTFNTAEILDLSASPLAWKTTASMTFARRWANAVLLADGTVLVVGGGASGQFTGPVLTPELYDPVSATWTQMAAQAAPRMYHSTAVLLPDGRVLSAGQSNGTLQNTGEIFSPPYLFAGARPTITSAPASVGYNQQFTITTPNFASIGRVALVRAGSVTHSNNFDQRYVDLTYASNGSNGLTATSPPDSNHAPPGWYMLFILSSGVPSVASWVQVG